jgi:hypothetical protein
MSTQTLNERIRGALIGLGVRICLTAQFGN